MARQTGWKEGTPFNHAMSGSWARGLGVEQVIEELAEIGYSVNKDFIEMYYANLDKEMNSFFEKERDHYG